MASDRVTVLLQRRGHVSAGGPTRREEAEGHAGCDGCDEGKREHGPVECQGRRIDELEISRCGAQRLGPRRRKEANAPRPHEEAGKPADPREDETLREVQPHQAGAARPEGSPNCRFLATRGGPGHQQSGHVRTRDDQQEPHGRRQHEYGRARHRVHPRVQERGEAHALQLGARRPPVRGVDGLANAARLGPGGLQARPGLQAADGVEPMGEPHGESPRVFQHRRRAHRNPDGGLPGQPAKPRAQHADDRNGMAVQDHRATDNIGIAPEPRAPEVVAEDGNQVGNAWIVLVGQQDPAQQCSGAEEREVTGAHHLDIDPRRIVGSREHHAAGDEAGHRCHGTQARLKDLEFGIGPRGGVGLRRPVRIGERQAGHHQSLRFRKRRRAEQHGVQRAEDGGVGPDPEPEYRHHRRGESWIASQASQGDVHVSQRRPNPGADARRPTGPRLPSAGPGGGRPRAAFPNRGDRVAPCREISRRDGAYQVTAYEAPEPHCRRAVSVHLLSMHPVPLGHAHHLGAEGAAERRRVEKEQEAVNA